jgi:tetratricopeptide (TPR) repeat protein
MCQTKSISGFSVFIFIMAVFSGCAGPAANINQGIGPVESLRPGYEVVYHANLQPGATLNSVQEELNKIGTSNTKAVFFSDDTPQFRDWHIVAHFSIDNDLIELQKGSVVYKDQLFSDHSYTIAQSELLAASAISTRFNDNLLRYTILVEKSKEGGHYPYVIFFEDLITFRFHKDDLAGAQTIADALYLLQQAQKDKLGKHDKQLADFEPIAAQYRALIIKPPVSEEQRKYIVQANALTKQKQYKKAEEKYRQVIELDPTSYPAAYFNMALLAAQENFPGTAIFRMKQYLLLAPDAKDARNAQDKIYEWELVMQK